LDQIGILLQQDSPKARIVKAAQELIDSNPERSWIPLSQMLVDLIGAPGVLNKSYTAGRGNYQGKFYLRSFTMFADGKMIALEGYKKTRRRVQS
jgi:hypothetical protein